MYLDSHAHLEADHYGKNIPQIIERARQAGIGRILAIGNGTPGDTRIEETLEIAIEHDIVYASVGVHPHEAAAADRDFLYRLALLARRPKVIAWGEIGLDYHYDFSPPEAQQRVLDQQLEMAGEAGLPVIFHCREAEKDLLERLERWRRTEPWGVLHCFSGSRQLARQGMDLGMLVSFSGILTFGKAAELREIAREIPADRLLVETDSPYLAPVPYRGQKNEPRHVVEIVKVLADLRGTDPVELTDQITQNFGRLFGLRAMDSTQH